ncbi:MAG: methylase, partial [Lachnospiraceae bacterium]|nr:methylase [Lachnospiraceae bacterium]
EIYDVKDIKAYIDFEEKVKLDNTSFIDGYIPTTRVLIEQKSKGKNLNAAIKQSDGSMLTPFQQAKRYNSERPFSKQARWIITCNFTEFYIYDMEHPTGDPIVLSLKDLPDKYDMLNILVDTKKEEIINEVAISKEAGDLIGKLYDAILEKYDDKENVETLKSLNILAVRLVFLYYAEDAEILQSKTAFTDYIRDANPEEIRAKLIQLFKVLDTEKDSRDKYLSPSLARFPYVNGGLFEDENIEIPLFDENIKKIMLDTGYFDWQKISPTIFGAMFESTLNPDLRRKGGMHYTSIENIHKVIDPLFLDDLNDEYNKIESMEKSADKVRKAESFIDKISKLSFLDPACGSGNFLTETYICLRRLENKCLRIIREGDKKSKSVIGERTFLRCDDTIKVKLDNFFGIEINDFATTVA